MAQSSQENDKDTEILIAVGLTLVAIALVVAFFGDRIAYAVLVIARWHLIPTGLVYAPHAEAAERIAMMTPADAAEVGIMGALGVANSAFRVYGVIIALGAVVMGVRYLRANPHRYNARHDAWSLLERNARVWPAVQPVVGLDLLNEPRETGPWRVADDYIRLALRHQLIERVVDEKLLGSKAKRKAARPGTVQSGDWLPVYRIVRSKTGKTQAKRVTHADHYPRSSVDEHRFRLADGALKAVLVDQLGEPLFRDGQFSISRWQHWPLQHRALLAALLPIAFGPGKRVGRNLGLSMFNQFNASFYYPNYRKTGKPPIRLSDLDTRGVNPIIARYLGVKYTPRAGEALDAPIPGPEGGAKAVRAFMRQHAWLNVTMLAILLHARRRGTLITPDFIWLRPIDRTLFYTMNSAGRQNTNHATPFPEACGVFAHYFVEDTLGEAVIDPDVDTAMNGFEAALIDEGWLAEPSGHEQPRDKR